MSEKVYVNICDTKKCPGPVYAVKTGDTVWRWGVAAALTLLGSLTVVGGILWKRTLRKGKKRRKKAADR